MTTRSQLIAVSYAAEKTAAAIGLLAEAASALESVQDDAWRAPELDTALHTCASAHRCFADIMRYMTQERRNAEYPNRVVE